MKYAGVRFKIDGETVTEAEFNKRRRTRSGVPRTTKAYSKPLVGMAMGVHPKQVEAARERVKALGLTGVDYQSDGQIVFTTRGNQGRRGFLKAMQCHDNDGGYRDG